MAVTLKDIAKKANVSITTVSRVINDQRPSMCSEETELHIRRIAAELGYAPRSRKRGLETARDNGLRIGYVLGESTDRIYDPHFAQMLKGIEAESLASGVPIVFGCFTPGLYEVEVFRKIVADTGVGAVIYMSGLASPL